MHFETPELEALLYCHSKCHSMGLKNFDVVIKPLPNVIYQSDDSIVLEAADIRKPLSTPTADYIKLSSNTF